MCYYDHDKYKFSPKLFTKSSSIPLLWKKLQYLPSFSYSCDFCNNYVGSDYGYLLSSIDDIQDNNDNAFEKDISQVSAIYICPHCGYPTLKIYSKIFPQSTPSILIKYAPNDIKKTYEEARKCFSCGAYTGTVLLCRKLLVHIATNQGANENCSFADAIKYLEDNHKISESTASWSQMIRKMGNLTTHNLINNTANEANLILLLSATLISDIYENTHIASDLEKHIKKNKK